MQEATLLVQTVLSLQLFAFDSGACDVYQTQPDCALDLLLMEIADQQPVGGPVRVNLNLNLNLNRDPLQAAFSSSGPARGSARGHLFRDHEGLSG
eukprot:1108929-Rhodomonas_salina.2